MDLIALFKTLGLCLVSIIIEAASYTKNGKAWFESLHQPRFAISLQVWYFVGGIYYLFFGIIAYRLFHGNDDLFSKPAILLVLVMLLNGLGNFIIFKYRSIKWFYIVIYPFGLLLLAFVLVLLPSDKISAGLAAMYFVWLIYDVYYAYYLWQLNKEA